MDRGYLKKLLFSFKGRATRLEFWMVSVVFYAYSIIFFIPLVDFFSGGGESEGTFLLLMLLFCLFILYVFGAVHIKRWHDRDKSGWWILINLIPGIGYIWSVWDNGFLRGTEGNNRFGEDPLEISINNKEEITASEESSSEETTGDKEEISGSEDASSEETTSDKEEITSSEEAISDNDKDSPEDKLTKLSELKEKGLIDEEDYNSKKEEILKTI